MPQQQQQQEQLEEVPGIAATTQTKRHSKTASKTNKKISITELVNCIGNEQRFLLLQQQQQQDHNGNDNDEGTRIVTNHPFANISPELERRVRDYHFAQKKRFDKYHHGVGGTTTQPQPQQYGIMGMYQHLHNIRLDLEWAEDCAYRRKYSLPYCSWNDSMELHEQYGKRIPYFTYSLICICTIMLLVVFMMNDYTIETIKSNPMIGPSTETLIQAGARVTSSITEQNQWYRLFTSLFLHAGIVHYMINMLALYFIGQPLEQTHGMYYTTFLFVVPGIGGNLLSSIFLPQYISVGASGGIFGLLGACITDILLNWKLLFLQTYDDHDDNNNNIDINNNTSNHNNHHADINQHHLQQPSTSPKQQKQQQQKIKKYFDSPNRRRNFWCVVCLVSEIFINVILGFITPVIDNWAHLGGLLFGAFCASSFFPTLGIGFFDTEINESNDTDPIDTSSSNHINHDGKKFVITFKQVKRISIRYLGLFITIVSMFISTMWLLTTQPGDDIPCPNCRYVSCIPFPFFTNKKWWYCDDCDFVIGTLYMDQNDTYYTKIELQCPQDILEIIDVTADNITELDLIEKKLPSYCRSTCPSVFN